MIDGLKLEQSHTENLYHRLITGTKENHRGAKYVAMDLRINNMILDAGEFKSNEELEDFFRSMIEVIEY